MMTPHHENGFDHLDLTVAGVSRRYDFGEKFDPNTDGPPGWLSDPFILFYVSFAATSGGRRPHGTLHYALSRIHWEQVTAPSEPDRKRLRDRALARLQEDVQAIDRGDEVAWLNADEPLFLPATRTSEHAALPADRMPVIEAGLRARTPDRT